MNRIFVYGIAVFALTQQLQSMDLVPWPKSVKRQGQNQEYHFTPGSRIFYDTRSGFPRSIEHSLEPLAKVLSEELELITGIKPKLVRKIAGQIPDADDIRLEFSKLTSEFAITEAEENQAYTLMAGSKGLIVRSQYTKGISYGTATLLQALKENSNGRFSIPGVIIDDEPTAAFRAIMIDVARRVHTIDVIKDVIRSARLYKIRYLHLHITDNEIFTFPFTPVTNNLKQNFTYSRQELIDLVAYADARGVTLIPELDLPGHTKKLRESGYLSPNDANDFEVASKVNYKKIQAIIDDILEVFSSTPYFHIGGDESGAGKNLEPFLAAMNKHLRGNPPGGKRRMLVWEGFHGIPSSIPATGKDRVIVYSWESSYNAPWNLLEGGYQLINASWKPTYVAGGGGFIAPGNTSGKKFFLEDIYRWNKDIFMHWEPGRPVFDDRGPKDSNREDSEWDANNINKQDQIIGGQLLFWEQEEDSIMINLRGRAPIVAERLWNPEKNDSFEEFTKRSRAIDDRVMTIVQPVEILPFSFETGVPIAEVYNHYEGESIEITLRNRTKIPDSTIRYSQGNFSNSFDRVGFNNIPPITSTATAYSDPFTKSGGFGLRAKLFRSDGTAIDGNTWANFNNWKNRIQVTDYDIGRRTPFPVPNLDALPDSKIIDTYQMPWIRGILRNIHVRGQKMESLFTPPKDGEFEISLKTQSGHATLYIDLNRNGIWETDEVIIKDTPNTEVWQRTTKKLTSDKPYRLRIDHASGLPRPVLGLTIEGPGTNGSKKRCSTFLTLPEAKTSVRGK